MPTKIEELQASSPAYQAMPTGEFARRMYDKYYADKMSYGEFAQKTGAPNDFAGVTAEVKPSFSGVSADVDTSAEKVQKTADTGIARLIKGEPQQRGNEFTRIIGDLGAREVLQGAYGTYGALGGDAINQFVLDPLSEATGGAINLGTNGRSYRQLASDAADQMGMRRPDTPTARVMADIGEGLSGTALTMGAGAVAAKAPGLMGQVGKFFMADPKFQLASAALGSGAASVARESGASEGNQLLAGLVGGLSPAALRVTGGEVLRRAVRGSSPDATRETIENFRAAGTVPTVGQATQSRGAQAIESMLSATPGGAGRIAKKAAQEAEEVSAKMDDIGLGLAGRQVSGEQAGRSIEKGLATFKRSTQAMRDALYWQVDKLIPPGTATPMANTTAMLKRLTTPNPGARQTTGAMINSKIAQLAENIETDLLASGNRTLPYTALKEIRTRIGEEIADNILTVDRPTAQYKQLYGALSRDMDDVARAQGPQAAAAAKRATNYYRVSEQRMEQLERVIQKNGGPEQIFNAAFSGTKDGATTLRTVVKSLPDESRRDLTAAFVRRLGRAISSQQNDAGDAFSMGTFLTNWNKISPEARSALFDVHGPEFRRNMDRIAAVASNIRDGSKVYANSSGTSGRSALIGSTVGAGFTAGGLALTGNFKGAAAVVAATAMSALGANKAARMMTDPDWVAFLARNTSMPLAAIPAQAQVLRQMAEKKDDPSYAELANLLEEQAKSSISEQGDNRGNNGQ